MNIAGNTQRAPRALTQNLDIWNNDQHHQSLTGHSKVMNCLLNCKPASRGPGCARRNLSATVIKLRKQMKTQPLNLDAQASQAFLSRTTIGPSGLLSAAKIYPAPSAKSCLMGLTASAKIYPR